MGGYGSGRSGGKATVDASVTISAYKMQRGGAFVPGQSGSMLWGRDGEPTASVHFEVDPAGNALTLRYTLANDQRRQNVREEIDIERRRANYGGHKVYFLCPRCNSRRSKLYLPTGAWKFLCRRCYDLTYQSCKNSNSKSLVALFARLAKRERGLSRRG